MAMPLEMTLGELRREVLALAGVATSGNTPRTIQPVVNALLNECQSKISLRAVWARRLIDVVVPLVADTRDYDIPDVCDGLGGLQRLDLTNTEGRRVPLRYDDSLWLESNTTTVNTPGLPTAWQIVDDIIRFDRVPDTDVWTTLTIRLLPRPIRLVEDSDRCIVDSQALIQLATIKLKEHLEVGANTRADRAEFERYLVDLRSTKTGASQSFGIASERLDGPAYWRLGTPMGAFTQPYSQTWNPVGGW